MTRFARDIGLALAGYGIAVVVASFFCVFVLFAADLVSGVSWNWGMPGDFLSVLLFGVAITALTAWPGFAATLVAARIGEFRHIAFFAICGVATAVLAVLLYGAFIGDRSFISYFLAKTPAIFVGGLAGGLAYALYARRSRVFA